MKSWFRLNYPQLFNTQLCANLHSALNNANYHARASSEPDKDDSQDEEVRENELTPYDRAVIRVNSEGQFCNDHIHTQNLTGGSGLV